MSSNSIISPDVNNDSVCEALGCSYKATDKITVKIGTKGTISLFLCRNCILRFPVEKR